MTIFLFRLPTGTAATCPTMEIQEVGGLELSVPIFVRYLELPPAETSVLEVGDLDAGADPVMRLFMADPSDLSKAWYEVAFDDNSGDGEAPKIIINPQVFGVYILVVHAYRTDLFGRATLRLTIDGQLAREERFSFGGTTAKGCPLDDGDEMRIGYVPDGANYHQLLAVKSPGTEGLGFENDLGYGKGSIGYSNRTGGAQKNTYIVGALQPGSDVFHGADLIWNDLSLDRDGDGLGDQLEVALRTCPLQNDAHVTADGWRCGRFASSDTDNDGLSDREEVFGIYEPDPAYVSSTYEPDSLEFLPLRYWGASPTHKDVFVEVDAELGISIRQALNGKDGAELYTRARSIYIAYHDFQASGQLLANPDGKAGIDIHLDAAAAAGHADLSFGNNRKFTFNSTPWGSCGHQTDCASSNENISACATYGTHNSMSPLREGRFLYACMGGGGGGQTAGEGTSFEFSAASWQTFAHELGHTMLLDHGGGGTDIGKAENCKPNYFSLMSYCQDGLQSSLTRDSTMPAQFSAGELHGSVLNPSSLCEFRGLAQDPQLPPLPADHLDSQHLLYDRSALSMPLGFVDWNFDGDFNDCPTRGDVSTSGKGEGPGFGPTFAYDKVASTKGITDTPALVRVSGDGADHLGIFYVRDKKAWYRLMGFKGGKCRPLSEDAGGEDCGIWTPEQLVSVREAEAIAVERFDVGYGEEIFAALVTSKGTIAICRGIPALYGTNPGLNFNCYPQFGESRAVGKPELFATADELWLAWRERDGWLKTSRLVYDGFWGWQWTEPEYILDETGCVLSSNVSPTFGQSGAGHLHLLRTRPDDAMEFLVQWDGVLFGPSDFPLGKGSRVSTRTKPALAWTRFDLSSDAGFGTIWRREYTANGKPFVTRVGEGGRNGPLFRLRDAFVNEWYSVAANRALLGYGDGKTTVFDFPVKETSDHQIHKIVSGTPRDQDLLLTSSDYVIVNGGGKDGVDQVRFNTAPATGEKIEANFAPWNRTIGLDLIAAQEDENIHGVTFRFRAKAPDDPDDEDEWWLELYPYADGFASREVVGGFNDFAGMAQGLCAKWGDGRPCGE